MDASPTHYRPAAGICLFNKGGKVFLGKRKKARGPYIWQMPQGGIDDGETSYQAAIRELYEETGVSQDLIIPLAHIENWLHYEFPPHLTGSRMTKSWRGQKQKWFAFRYTGTDNQIDLSVHNDIEFSDWRWGTLALAVKLIVPFKRSVYEQVQHNFSKFEMQDNG